MKSEWLNKRVVIKSVTYTRNALNESVPAETTIATVWATVKPIRQKEKLTAGKPTADTDYLVTIRYRDDVDGTCVIQYGTKTLQITGVVNINERNESLEISCVETN